MEAQEADDAYTVADGKAREVKGIKKGKAGGGKGKSSSVLIGCTALIGITQRQKRRRQKIYATQRTTWLPNAPRLKLLNVDWPTQSTGPSARYVLANGVFFPSLTYTNRLSSYGLFPTE